MCHGKKAVGQNLKGTFLGMRRPHYCSIFKGFLGVYPGTGVLTHSYPVQSLLVDTSQYPNKRRNTALENYQLSSLITSTPTSATTTVV